MEDEFDAREAGWSASSWVRRSDEYQASYFFVPTALLVLFLMVRRRRILPGLVFAAACLVVSSAHWLKNWIAYGDPFYPLLHKYLPVHPFHEGAGDRMYWDAQFLLTGTPWEKVRKPSSRWSPSRSFPMTGKASTASGRCLVRCSRC